MCARFLYPASLTISLRSRSRSLSFALSLHSTRAYSFPVRTTFSFNLFRAAVSTDYCFPYTNFYSFIINLFWNFFFSLHQFTILTSTALATLHHFQLIQVMVSTRLPRFKLFLSVSNSLPAQRNGHIAGAVDAIILIEIFIAQEVLII